jgi:hypothetical protein
VIFSDGPNVYCLPVHIEAGVEEAEAQRLKMCSCLLMKDVLYAFAPLPEIVTGLN